MRDYLQVLFRFWNKKFQDFRRYLAIFRHRLKGNRLRRRSLDFKHRRVDNLWFGLLLIQNNWLVLKNRLWMNSLSRWRSLCVAVLALCAAVFPLHAETLQEMPGTMPLERRKTSRCKT